MDSHSVASFSKQCMAFMLVISCLTIPSLAVKLILYPCTGFEAIRWVRDSTFCNQYYICHFGQPLAMPPCPTGQVWSNTALNCVPQESRWNDCVGKHRETNAERSTEQPTTPVTATVESSNIEYSVSPPTPAYVTISLKNSPSESMTVSVNHLPNGSSQIKLQEVSVETKNDTRLEEIIAPKYPHYIVEVNRNDETVEANKKILKVDDKDIENVHNSRREKLKIDNSEVREFFGKFLHQRGSSSTQGKRNEGLQRFHFDLDHICFRNPGVLLPHPENCHWYYNCSLANLEALADDMEPLETDFAGGRSSDDGRFGDRESFFLLTPFRVLQAGVFVWECRFPQLFDEISGTCREFMNVDCKSRFEPVDQCEYSVRQCHGQRCAPCHIKFGSCRGREDGVYPLHEDLWRPGFVTCYQERNIALDECAPPTPVFSPQQLECVSLFHVPKIHGGFLPDCSTRPDNYYPDEQGRCGIFYRCALGIFRGYDECPPGTVFDPAIPACQIYSQASRPCGEGLTPPCADKADGYYADPYGRCTSYFHCQNGLFQQYLSCDLGLFDPLTQKCVLSTELTVRPCGLQANPCEKLPTGKYPDMETGCQHFIECHHGNMITNRTCEKGTVFSAITGKCDLPEHAPPPCGMSTLCLGKPDGRYPATNRGCSFFYECVHEEFLGLMKCTESDGGIFFNPDTGNCDYPHNICPPCGYRWWGCPSKYDP